MRIFLLAMVLVSAIQMNAVSKDNPTIIDGQASKWALFLSSNSILPSNIVNALVVDAKNNLWIGTETGLAVFKDSIFKVFHAGANSIPGERITTLMVDDFDYLWIGTFANGIGKYKEGQPWTYYSTLTVPNLPNNYVTAIAQVNATQYWIGTRGGVVQLLGTTMTVFNASNSPLNTNFINAIGITSNTARWIGTDVDGVWKNYNNAFTQYNAAGLNNSKLPNNHVRSIYVDQIDRIFFGTDGGMAVFNNPDWSIYSKTNSDIPSNRVYSIITDLGDHVWVGTDAGLARYDGKNWFTYNFSNTNGGLPANAINAIVQDDSMYVWVATGSGLTKLLQRSFNQTENSTICAQEGTMFEVKKTISYTATYQWQVNIGGGWANLKDEGVYSGVNTSKLYLTNVGAELNNAQYRCQMVYNTIGKDSTNAITLTVNPRPLKPSINKLSDKLFTDPASSFQWYYASGDILIPGAISQSHTPGLSTEYYVIIKNAEGCSTKSDAFYSEGNALDENGIGMTIYPNPSKGKFTISGSSWLNEVSAITIVDNKGTIVYSEKALKLTGNFTKHIDLNVPSGTYFIKVSAGNNRQSTYKIIIQ